MNVRKLFFRITLLSVVISAIYGLGRLYFHLTGGFTIGHISSDFAYQPQWEVRPLVSEEEQQLEKALNQAYHYLGKGCQSYVFASQDGHYVIKFFKYQRFRLQPWLAYFPPLPAIVKYREEKQEKKWNKLNSFVTSWKIAFEHLKKETGLIYVHLNKTHHLQKELVIKDKLGLTHQLNLDQMEFCIQKRAQLLCDALLDCKKAEDEARAKLIIDKLLTLILSEYARGLADNDHALMQNTGISQEQPIHIDVGQFVISEEIKKPEKHNQELFTKTYKFKKWLAENYPTIADYLNDQLYQIIGPEYFSMQPIWWNKPDRKG